jgi:hypothetical protein
MICHHHDPHRGHERRYSENRKRGAHQMMASLAVSCRMVLGDELADRCL